MNKNINLVDIKTTIIINTYIVNFLNNPQAEVFRLLKKASINSKLFTRITFKYKNRLIESRW